MVPLKCSVIGGDRRAACLSARLLREGHSVRCFALERAELPKGAQRAGCLQGCVYGAEWIFLPVPTEKHGLLLTPLSAETLPMAELLPVLWPGQILIGGAFSQESSLTAVRGGLAVYDLLRRRDYTVGNAALTAEGALALLLQESESSLLSSHVLLTGWGRVASLLAPRLRSLGAYVTVAARKAGDRATAEALGLNSCRFEELPRLLEDVDLLVNTVPAQVISREDLARLRKGTLLLELASEPGFDREEAAALGLRPLYAPGLPGQFAPEAAAGLIWETAGAIAREREESDGT